MSNCSVLENLEYFIMKRTIKTTVLVFGSLVSMALISCVQDDDYKVPSYLGEENNKRLSDLLSGSASLISISELKNQFVNRAVTEIESDIYIKGYVTSSDATGNFFKEFFIQDQPSDPTAGLKVVLNQTDTYNQFNIGREVYIKLQGLFLGGTRVGDGVIAIGGKKNSDGDEVDALTVNQIPKHVFRSEITEILIPVQLKFSQINSYHIGMFVSIEHMQFPIDLKGQSYVDPKDDFDTIRMLESCEGFGYVNFPLETSAFANFKNEIIPADGGGTISGIVNKTYNGSAFVLVLNSIEDVNISDSKCTPLDLADYNIIFEEDFNSAIDNTKLDLPNWTNFAEVGTEFWTEQVFRSNGYTEFSGYNTGDAINVSWLISPGIQIDEGSNGFLNFKSAQHHLESLENTLEVLLSSNYNGVDVLAANWEPINANLATMSDTWYNFVDSGLIDISGNTGTLYVAFKVNGSGTNTLLDGAYHIDDFRILSKK